LDKKIIENTLEQLYKSSKERKFDESIELIVTLKNITLKNKSQRVNYSINIPKPYITKVNSLLFVKDTNLAKEVKGIVDKIVMEDEISKISKKDGKKLAREYGVFLAEGPVMLTVGKYLGQVLSPRGKMPLIAPPNPNAIKNLINNANSKLIIDNSKNKNSVSIQLRIGKRSQAVSDVSQNVLAVYNSLLDKLPAGKQNIKKVYLKTTMSNTVMVGDKE
jgi:large subunit ribosomal protein L1